MSYLTINEACQYLNVCRNTLLAMIRDGRVKAVDFRQPGAKNAVWRIATISLQELGRWDISEAIKLREIERRIGL